ncbi:MaoC family dehydratase [Cohaesibacter sp. ES.047]|uniref:MaoC family dehydratase n=1 Tax=Cohaesibacter sp. ES.047 TaxID=1798205 RepID=UPI000BB77972|nr:MaoC family dehydratase [Cohaesibacter sp. ES.047]
MNAPLKGVAPRTVYYEEMSIGQSESFRHMVSDKDISAFAAVSGDYNPVHVDKAYGEASRFGGNIAHGLYTASLFSALLGMRLPGPGAIYVEQTLKFMAPVRPGDELEVSVSIKEMIDRGRRVILDCEAKVDGALVLSGEATVLAPPKPAQ